MNMPTDPDQKDSRAAKLARLEAEQRARSAFSKSPAGRARSARASGAQVFQIDLTLSETTGHSVALVGTFTTSTPTATSGAVIESIEREGWKLEHVGYVYRLTGSVSRDKFLGSGQQEATHGEIVGIYIFRATELPTSQAPADLPPPTGRANFMVD